MTNPKVPTIPINLNEKVCALLLNNGEILSIKVGTYYEFQPPKPAPEVYTAEVAKPRNVPAGKVAKVCGPTSSVIAMWYLEDLDT